MHDAARVQEHQPLGDVERNLGLGGKHIQQRQVWASGRVWQNADCRVAAMRWLHAVCAAGMQAHTAPHALVAWRHSATSPGSSAQPGSPCGHGGTKTPCPPQCCAPGCRPAVGRRLASSVSTLCAISSSLRLPTLRTPKLKQCSTQPHWASRPARSPFAHLAILCDQHRTVVPHAGALKKHRQIGQQR